MKRFLGGALLSALVVTAAFAASGYRDLLSTDARRLQERTKNLYLLDVRTVEEYRQAHLQGAVLIPLGELEKRLGEIPRNRPILVYCAVGSRSALAAGYLSGKGYRELYNMADGIVGWYRNRLPVQR